MYRSGCLFMAIVMVIVGVFAVSLVGCENTSMEDEKLIDFTATSAQEIPAEVLNVFENVDSVHVSQTVDMEATTWMITAMLKGRSSGAVQSITVRRCRH